MGEKKYRREHFAFYDSAGIEAHLDAMMEQGWQLENITSYFWQYKKIQPQKLKHKVIYFPELMDTELQLTEQNELVVSGCQQMDWRYLAKWREMRIFCAREEAAASLPVQDAQQLDILHNLMKRSITPAGWLLLIISLLNLSIRVFDMFRHPLEELSNHIMLCIFLLWTMFLVLCLGNLWQYRSWYRQAVRSGNARISTKRSYKTLLLGADIFLLLFIVLLLFSLQQQYGTAFLQSFLIGLAVLWFAVWGIWAFMRQRAKSDAVMHLVTGVSAGVLIMILLLAVSHNLPEDTPNSLPEQTYTFERQDGTIKKVFLYQDSLPLTIEDLQPLDNAVCSYEMETEASLILTRTVGYQDLVEDDKYTSDLCYEIADLKFAWLSAICLNPWQEQTKIFSSENGWCVFETRPYQEMEQNADSDVRLYQMDVAQQESNVYLFRWPKRIVTVYFGWKPTQEQLDTALAKLAP